MQNKNRDQNPYSSGLGNGYHCYCHLFFKVSDIHRVELTNLLYLPPQNMLIIYSSMYLHKSLLI